MIQEKRETVVLDTSVLINFLRIDRMDLLSRHPKYKFIITDHVSNEISSGYPKQVDLLTASISAGVIQKRSVNSENELEIFGRLQNHRLGAGECAAVAMAVVHGFILALDDGRARKEALLVFPGLIMLDTESIMVSVIQAGLIDVPTADAIKNDWETNHRFRLRITTFQDLL